MFLLDTNVVSELRRPDRAHAAVVDWARRTDSVDLRLSVVTIWEIEDGVLRSERRDATAGRLMRHWFESVLLPHFAERLLPIGLSVVRACAPLHVPDRRPERDSLIAATALVHGLTVVTRNVADFAPMGVPVLNPWDPA